VGWLFTRWTLPDLENRQREPGRADRLPIAFAVLFALFGAYNWAIERLTPDQAWAIALGWILLAVPGALVARPFLGLLVMSPFVLVNLVPPVGAMTVGWDGGWVLGIAGAAAGAAAGAVMGWLFKRWIMPEYEKRRARESALRQPGSTDGTRSSRSMAGHCAAQAGHATAVRNEVCAVAEMVPGTSIGRELWKQQKVIGRLCLLLYWIVCRCAKLLPRERGYALRARFALDCYALTTGGLDDDFAEELFALVLAMPALLDELERDTLGTSRTARCQRHLLSVLRQEHASGAGSLNQ
jgi:hypothetical protein